MKVLIISGTPGTGKSTLAKLLARKLKFKHLNLEPTLKKISEGYDRKKQCCIIDIKKLNKKIIKIMKIHRKADFQDTGDGTVSLRLKSQVLAPSPSIIKQSRQNLVISSHLAHHLPPKYVDLCIIAKCSDLKKLKQRLQKRRYSRKKIGENLQCEIFDVCLNEAKEKKHKLLVVDTCKKINQKELIAKIRDVAKV